MSGKKVAIVGAAPSSRDLAPFADETWEIWACSPSARDLPPRITTWFEIHALVDLASKRWAPWATAYIEWLKTRECRVVMQSNDLIPKAVAYPKDEIAAKYGLTMLTSSIAWMIALAMYEGATEIGIFGVDMAAQSEYDYERPGCKFWIQKARDAGIIVTVPPHSDLDYPAPLYGFDDASPLAVKLKAHAMELQDRIDLIANRCGQIDNEKAALLKEHNHLTGALDELNYIRKSFVSFSGPDLR